MASEDTGQECVMSSFYNHLFQVQAVILNLLLFLKIHMQVNGLKRIHLTAESTCDSHVFHLYIIYDRIICQSIKIFKMFIYINLYNTYTCSIA